MSRIISKTVQVLEGKSIFALKIYLQRDNANLEYVWARHFKKFLIFSAASSESLFKIYLITNITI